MKLKDRKGILLPAKMKPGSWVVLGPPGVGKSHLIHRIGGWPDEVCVDVSRGKWWALEALTHRPREIHLALPFDGIDESLSVYDERWKAAGELPDVDLGRVRIPTKKNFILAPNWRAKFVFDFILPPPAWLFGKRRERLSSDDVRLVDMDLTQEWVAWQVNTHWRIARFFHQAGLQVMVRPFNTARPFSFPVLKKIVKKSTKPCHEEISPALDWSRVRCVKRWINEVASEAEIVSSSEALEIPTESDLRCPEGTSLGARVGTYTGRISLPLSIRKHLLAIESSVAGAGRILNLRKQ